MRRNLFILLLFAMCFSSTKAQEILLPLTSKHVPTTGKTSGSAVELPFFDDFARLGATPDAALWESGGATVGVGYGELPPTIGMVTLDALDATGNLYPQASTSSFAADTLMSQPLRLDSLGVADSLVLSFFYLPGGGSGNLWERIGDTPDPADSIYLDFYSSADSSWRTVWARGGTSVDTLMARTGSAWQYVAIAIDDPVWLDSGFRFRFRNHCSLDATSKRGMKGNCDQWNIDYILVDTARSVASEAHWRDIAFVNPAPSMLSHYRAMPARQYRLSEMSANLSMTITNLFTSELATHYSYSIINDSGDTVHRYDGGFENAPVDSYQQSAAHAEPPVGYAFPESDDPTSYTIVHTIREGVGGDSHSSNDTVVFHQHFADYYAYDDGTPENGYGLTSTASRVYLAYRFDLNEADTLTAVDLYFNRTLNGENEGIMFNITIWQTGSDGQPSTVLYRDNERRRPAFDNMNTYHRYILESPIVVDGSIFVGFEQTGNDFINLGFDRNTQSADRIWYLTSTAWQQSILRGSLMLRPCFGAAAALSNQCLEDIVVNHTLYPNPADNNVTITNLPSGSRIKIYDHTGHLILSTTDNIISTAGYPSGLYIIHIVTPNGKTQNTKLTIIH